ncbi:hypothetical protein D021_0473B, partial [Vibrio parahaemolyticus 10296]
IFARAFTTITSRCDGVDVRFCSAHT